MNLFSNDKQITLMGLDSEGSPSRVWSVQVSVRVGTGYTIRGYDTDTLNRLYEWIQAHRPLLSMHYAVHDMEVLEKGLGWDVESLDIFDTMIAAYNLCTSPGGLKANAYREAGMLMSDYSELMQPVDYPLALEYLQRVASAVDAPFTLIEPKPIKPKRAKKGQPPPIIIPPIPDLIQQWPDPEPEIISNGNGVRVYKPQGISKLVNRILSDIASGKTLKSGETTDPRDRWKKLDDRAKAPVIDAIGDMPEPTLDDIPLEKAVTYASRDADSQLRITPILMSKIRAMGLEECCQMDHDCLPMIYRMQKVGMQLAPPEFWDDIEKDCRKQMDSAQYKIYQATGKEINPNSGDQVAALLYDPVDRGGLGLTPPAYTEGGEDGEDSRGSTSDKCLQDLLAVSPIVEFIADYREAAKVLGTYVEPLRRASRTGDGRVHPEWKYTRTHTGRFATTNPNVLAIPIRSPLGERCRHGFVAPAGKILYDSDLSQIEMRLCASESQDERLMKAYWDGADIHSLTASEMFGVKVDQVERFQRQAGKICGFALINGISAQGLCTQFVLYHAAKGDGSRWSVGDCEDMIREWFNVYPGVKRFQQDCVRETQQTGLARENIGGRIRYLPQIWSFDRQVRAEAERCTYSHRIQSGANAILRKAMKKSWDELKRRPGVEPLAVVHDEKLLELFDTEEDRTIVECTVNWAFTTAVKLKVPVEAEGGFGENWGTAHT